MTFVMGEGIRQHGHANRIEHFNFAHRQRALGSDFVADVTCLNRFGWGQFEIVTSDDLVVGPITYERLAPLKQWRLIVDGDARAGHSGSRGGDSVHVAMDVVLKFVWSSGVALTRQADGRPLTVSSPGSGRSCVNSSLLTPISTL